MDTDDESLSSGYPLSFGGRSSLLSSMYYLHHNPNYGEIEKQQVNTIIHNLFPNVLNHNFIFYSTFDYLNDLMTRYVNKFTFIIFY